MSFNASITDDGGDESDGKSSDDDVQEVTAAPVILLVPRFSRRVLDVVKASHFEAYEFYRQIPEAHRAREYAGEYEKHLENFNRKFHNKYHVDALPTSFATAKTLLTSGGRRTRVHDGVR